MSENIVGIDIGATKTHIGIIRDSEVIKEVLYTTAAQAAKEDIIQQLIHEIEKLAGTDFSGIGIGVPGLVDETKGIIYDLWNIPSWKEVHLKKDLEAYFGKPVRMTNDANVFALGESAFGKGVAFKNLVGVTLGSGFGTGIVIDGILYSGSLSGAGELGDLPYLDGCIEDYCSGKFFRRQYKLSGAEAYSLAETGDTKALEIFEEYGEHLANALKIMIGVLSPHAIFLGGSVSCSYKFFEASLRNKLNAISFKRINERLIIAPSELEKSSLLGAAALFSPVRVQEIILN